VKLPFQLGRYTLIDLIGAGAFGRVYKAEVHGDMGFVSEFAVKVLDANVVASNPNVAAQMGDEARILAQLDHPNIVKVIDFLHEDHDVLGDVYYMVLEFVRGVDVGDMVEQLLLDSRPVPATAALHMGLMVADALDHAHTLLGRDGLPLGIVHRDLKPQNLMVNFRGQVKILDFGIAKARDDRLAARTQEGQTKGTVFYMSPEQLTGDNLDGRADLFSLGAILFELLRGRRLLDVDVATPADLARAMHTAFEMDIDARLEDLRSHLEAGHNGELPDEAVEGWIALLRSALQKDPQKRPISAGVMSEQLEWLRARHPQSEHRNFWAKQASMGLERNSGPFHIPLEEVPDVEEEPNSFIEAADFFGMEASTVSDEEVAASGRPEIPPPEVAVTRAMSVVEGTVRAFGSNSLRSITVPPNTKAPPVPPAPVADLNDAVSNSADVIQTLDTPAYIPSDTPADPDIEPTMAFGETSEAERTVPFSHDPSLRATDQVRSLPKAKAKAKSGSSKAPILLAGAAVLAALVLLVLWVSLGSEETTETGDSAVVQTESDSSTASAPTDAGQVESTDGATDTAEGDGKSGVENAAQDQQAAEATAESKPAAVSVEIPRALDPNPKKTAAERAEAEKRARERQARKAEREKARRERVAAQRAAEAAELARAKEAVAEPVTPAAVANSGVLHLSARPRCEVEINGKSYGTTDSTRRGVKLPVGTYKVRFVCDDKEECARFAKVSGVKTLKVVAGKETRYLADFYALNKKKGRR